MFRTNYVIRAFSDLAPHLKAINATGINSRNIVFNPTFNCHYLVSPSFIKLHLKKKSHLIPIHVCLG